MSNYALPFLHEKVQVTIDRPLGSTHPKWGFRYPVNYGYIHWVLAPDGEDLDAYVLWCDTPLESFEGICIAIIHRTDDDDDKLIIVPEGISFTDEEIRDFVHFQEQYFISKILR